MTPMQLATSFALAAEELQAKLVLKDFSAKYAPLVADAYAARPTHEPQMDASWRTAVKFVEKQFKQQLSRLKVEWVDTDPYASYDEMNEQVSKTGVLKIWTGASEHILWTPEQNWMFRAVHDYQAHIAGGHSFGLKGEMAAYNRHIKTFPRAAWDCLFTEIVGQVCTNIVKGGFPEQKICKLHGFDYQNIGVVDEEAYKLNFE